MTNLELVSLFIAGGVHDLGHPGLTNNYLINSKDELALTYNDQSVLENYHISQAFKILNHIPDCNIFEMYSNSSYKLLRNYIIQDVLFTDMTLHSKLIAKLKIQSLMF